MRQEFLSILRRAAGKLLLTRAAESAAVATTAGAVSAAIVELGWSLAQISLAWAAIVTALPMAIAILLLSSAGVRTRLAVPRAAVPLAAWCAALAAAGEIGLWRHWQELPTIVLVAAVLLVSALAGAIVRLAKGVNLADVAAYLDAKGNLRERLATAVELSRSPQADSPPAHAVYAQALEALRQAQPQAKGMWRRTQATAAAVAMGSLLCIAMTFLPALGPRPDSRRLQALAQSIDTMNAADRKELSDAFRQAAAAARNNPDVAAQLAAAAHVIEVKDAAELEQILRKLRAAGYRPLDVVPGNLLTQAGLAPPPAAGRHDVTPTPMARTGLKNAAASGQGGDATAQAPETVRVYNPLYHDLVKTSPGGASSDANAPATTFADAWALARARASDALARGELPQRYRRLIRDFFLEK